MHDLIVIGAGPAGMTAALYALRASKTVLVLEKDGPGGQMTHSPNIENYPGFTSISGNELADRMLEQVIEQGADFELEKVLSVSGGEIKTVLTDAGSHEARAVVVATGARHRMLGVPGEEQFVGNGISFCAVCDGAFYAGQSVAVIGGGNSALQEAVMLSDLCSRVTVIQNLDFLTGERKLAEKLEKRDNVEIILGSVAEEFFGDDNGLKGVLVKRVSDSKLTKMAFDGAFIAVGLIPESDLVKNLTAVDKYGYIVSDERCLTDCEGVFTAGDCRTKGIRQVSTAIADGACAALAACRYLDN